MSTFRASAALILTALSLTARGADWPQWGGTDGRNMVSTERDLPETFEPIRHTGEEASEPGKKTNVRWVVLLGSASYGNVTIAGGRVFVGTDDKSIDEDPRFTRTQGGMLKCFDEKSGALLWQLLVPKRTGYPKEYHYGYQSLGVCSSPLVDGDHVYVVSSAAEVLCLDVHGQKGGNRGPYVDEAKYLAAATVDGKPVPLKETDADILWRFDLMSEVAVIPHDAVSCSVLMHGDFLYLSTSNGVDHPHVKMLNPDAPALIVLDKHTGKLVAKENERICTRVFHCQWSSPSLGKVGDKTLVFFGGGDGFCYAFEALESHPGGVADLKCAWRVDANAPEYRTRDGAPIPYLAGDKRKKTSPNKNDGTYVGPSDVIATPVFHQGRVYTTIGQDPLHGRARGALSCIDAATGNVIWRYTGMDRSISTPAIVDGLIYVPDIAGRLHCVDAATGQAVWVYEGKAEAWGSALVADGKVYYGTQKDFWVLAAGKEMKELGHLKLGAPSYSTPVAANGVLYVASQRNLWAVEKQ